MTWRMFITWLIEAPLDIGSSILSRILTPFVVPFATRAWLPSMFAWMETHDNDLDGDNGWKTEHVVFLNVQAGDSAGMTALKLWAKRTLWLWRNAAYRYKRDCLGAYISRRTTPRIVGDIRTSDRPGHAGWLLITAGPYWEYYAVIPYLSNRCVRLRFGWKLKGWAEAWLRGERRDNEAMRVQYANPVKGFYR